MAGGALKIAFHKKPCPTQILYLNRRTMKNDRDRTRAFPAFVLRLVVGALVFGSSVSNAWLRPHYTDADVVERSELMVVGRLKEGLVSYTGERRTRYTEAYYAVVALKQIAAPRTREFIESTRDRWIAINFSNSQIVEACDTFLQNQ